MSSQQATIKRTAKSGTVYEIHFWSTYSDKHVSAYRKRAWFFKDEKVLYIDFTSTVDAENYFNNLVKNFDTNPIFA